MNFEENKKNVTRNFMYLIIGTVGLYFIYKKFIK